MSLHDMIQQDATTVFCNSDDFAETVTYYQRHGSSREIYAVVNRDALAALPENPDYVTPVFEVHVANDCVNGVSSEELNLGGDFLEFAARVGEAVSKRSIIRLVGHDEGMLILECR